MSALTMLADALDKDLPKGDGMKVHLAVLEEMSHEECIRALSRSAEQSNFFPTPHELLRLSGRAEAGSDPNREPMLALQVIFSLMRLFGPELKPIPGKIIRDKDEQGFVLLKPEREPDIHPHGLSDRIEAALLAMGLGSREAGLQAIARHPSVSRDAESPQWAGRTAQDIEQRWIRAYSAARE